jgi:hypothetical protein
VPSSAATVAPVAGVVPTDGTAALQSAQPPVPPEALAGKTMTVITDSVLLGAKQQFVSSLVGDGWQVDYRGQVSMTIKHVLQDLQKPGPPLGSIVVVGLGYNSSWQRNKANYPSWSAQFDGDADNLIATLKQLGAQAIVWVTLREPSPAVIPRLAKAEYNTDAWYFPYVNDRLRALQQRHPDLLLADWTSVSNRAGITFDAIHLNPDGARLMTGVIRSTLGI